MERINCRTGMTQIGGVLSHAGMRWKTCRPLRRRPWLPGISVSGRGQDRASDWGAHCRFDPGSARQLGELPPAVAVYAAGGRQALLASGNAGALKLLEQDK